MVVCERQCFDIVQVRDHCLLVVFIVYVCQCVTEFFISV
jgi:hypothetical protein